MNFVAQTFLEGNHLSRLLQINATIGVVMSQAIYVSFGCVCRGALLADFCRLKETWIEMAGPTRSSD